MRKNLLALSIGLFFAFILLEVFLRVYNPFPFRLKGDRIILPASETYIIPNTIFPELEDTIIHHKNSLGFRGEELNEDSEVKIIFVGGSTTECCYLSDGKDWPNLLGKALKKDNPNLWLNNAGLNGHSTRGHIILVEDALLQLKPDYIVFLVGLNEMHRQDLHRLENLFLKSETAATKNVLRDYSEVFNLIANLRRVQRAKQFGLWHNTHGLPDAPTLLMDSTAIAEAHQNENPLIQSYEARLDRLIATCLDHKITPILITQPHLAGIGIDPITGGNLETVLVDDYNGKLTWQILERYNQATREKASQYNIPCFELADTLEKSSAIFYDFTHYTNEGSQKIAEILFPEFNSLLNQ